MHNNFRERWGRVVRAWSIVSIPLVLVGFWFGFYSNYNLELKNQAQLESQKSLTLREEAAKSLEELTDGIEYIEGLDLSNLDSESAADVDALMKEAKDDCEKAIKARTNSRYGDAKYWADEGRSCLQIIFNSFLGLSVTQGKINIFGGAYSPKSEISDRMLDLPSVYAFGNFISIDAKDLPVMKATTGDIVSTITASIGVEGDSVILQEIGYIVSSISVVPNVDNATFEQPASLAFFYDLTDLPDGFPEQELYLMRWDVVSNKWQRIDATVDSKVHSINGTIEQLGTFTIVAPYSVNITTVNPLPKIFMWVATGLLMITLLILLIVFFRPSKSINNKTIGNTRKEMHSKEEITKNFELLGLSSPEERERFEELGTFRLGAKPSDSYVFIKNDNKSNILDVENEHAKLERDSG
jgi:hypothetical protein